MCGRPFRLVLEAPVLDELDEPRRLAHPDSGFPENEYDGAIVDDHGGHRTFGNFVVEVGDYPGLCALRQIGDSEQIFELLGVSNWVGTDARDCARFSGAEHSLAPGTLCVDDDAVAAPHEAPGKLRAGIPARRKVCPYQRLNYRREQVLGQAEHRVALVEAWEALGDGR